MDSKTNTNKPNILDIPHIKALAEAEKFATDEIIKMELHKQWLLAIKAEQVARGQRTKMTYRTK